MSTPPVPNLTPREKSAAILHRPWTVTEAIRDLRRPNMPEAVREVAMRRLAMAILSTLPAEDASTSSTAFRRAWERATAQTKPKRARSVRVAAWTPEELRARAQGFIVMPRHTYKIPRT